MTRLLLASIVLATTFGAAQPASAQHWCLSIWDKFCAEYHENKCWPEPYIEPDRAATMAPLDMMVAAGWRRQNLLGAAHFDRETNELTEAGRRKVYAILTQNPLQHRTVFLSRDIDPQLTSQRLRSVREFTGTFEEGKLAAVETTHLQYEGRPAEVVDSVNVRFYESQPVPALPAAGMSMIASTKLGRPS